MCIEVVFLTSIMIGCPSNPSYPELDPVCVKYAITFPSKLPICLDDLKLRKRPGRALVHYSYYLSVTVGMTKSDSSRESKLFQPLTIADGRIKLQHRVIYAPMTRNRGKPLRDGQKDGEPTRAWYPDELMADYYGQRANDGGLLISEGIPPSEQVHSFLAAPSLGVNREMFLKAHFLTGYWLPRCPWPIPSKTDLRMEESHGRRTCERRVYICSALALWTRSAPSSYRSSVSICIRRTVGC